MKDCPIFITSADSYSDLWPVFFDMFKKYWPDYSGVIYLNTEEKTYSKDGLNIICTQVGKNKSFGITFRKGLDLVDSDNVLFLMIDFLFMGSVNGNKIQEYFAYFIDNKLDSLCLVNQKYPNTTDTEHPELLMVNPPAPYIMFSYQIAFWKKAVLYQMALPHEDPWMSEWYGTLRAEKMQIRLACIADDKYNPIPYNGAGCLHKGKWLDDAIEHLNSLNYKIDFDRRGYFKELPSTLESRIKFKWRIVRNGLMGSYIDLLRRRKIHDN